MLITLLDYNSSRIYTEFYTGTILTVDTGLKLLEVYACGHITVYIDDTKYKDEDAISQFYKRNFTDKDLQELHDNGNFVENNWFEYSITDKTTTITTYYPDIIENMDLAIELMNNFIKNKLHESNS